MYIRNMYTNIFSTFFICYVKEKIFKSLRCLLAVRHFINFSASTFVNSVGQIRCLTAISIPA